MDAVHSPFLTGIWCSFSWVNKKKKSDDLFMLCWKIPFSLAPIVLVSRRVRLPVRDLSSASQLTFCSFILTWSVSTSKLMFIHYSELKMGSKIIQKNYLLKLFLISDTAPNLNLVPARSGRDRNAQTCSFSDKNQPVFVFALVFLSPQILGFEGSPVTWKPSAGWTPEEQQMHNLTNAW